MSFKFSKRSLDNLKGVDPLLVLLVTKALDLGIMDFSVTRGVGTPEEQQKFIDSGTSLTLNSKYLIQSDGYSHAVDLYPYPIDMKKVNGHDAQEIAKFGVLAGIIKTLAKDMGIDIVWGGDWKSFFDAPHFEIVKGEVLNE